MRRLWTWSFTVASRQQLVPKSQISSDGPAVKVRERLAECLSKVPVVKITGMGMVTVQNYDNSWP